jgi:hypothetical protein
MQKIVLKHWNDFLDRCQVDQSKMPADQYREMKRAFFGGAGQLLIHLCEVLPPGDGMEVLNAVNVLNEEIAVFWQIEQVTQYTQMAAEPKQPKPAPPAGKYIPFTGDWCGLLKEIIPFLEDYQGSHPSVDVAIRVGQAAEDAKLIVTAADDVKKMEGDRPKTFASELTTLVNRYSKENGSNTPDYVLANFLQNSLAAFDLAVNQRADHGEPDLVTRIKNKLRGAGREIMDEIEKQTAETLHGYEKTIEFRKVPELRVGLKYFSVHQPGQLYEIMYIDRDHNKANVDISAGERKWQDTGLCLEYMRSQFENGEYYQVSDNVENVALFHNNSDAFRRWAQHTKGYKIVLLGHQTGVVLPKSVTREQLETEWKAFEQANRPKFKPGGMMPGQGGSDDGDKDVADDMTDAIVSRRPHALDEKGFFFYLKTGGIGWCRMYGGTPWFMAQTADGQWYTGKQVNQTDIWNAKASEVSAEEDAALRKTIPNE